MLQTPSVTSQKIFCAALVHFSTFYLPMNFLEPSTITRLRDLYKAVGAGVGWPPYNMGCKDCGIVACNADDTAISTDEESL